ncbi:ATPdependent RNA helicase [Chytridiales sp. JEL 0842]|nr:ATPdependent RNA helicase [Chytridiales sp. JEL 0842]
MKVSRGGKAGGGGGRAVMEHHKKKKEDNLPVLHLDRSTVNRLEYILSEYKQAKKLLDVGNEGDDDDEEEDDEEVGGVDEDDIFDFGGGKGSGGSNTRRRIQEDDLDDYDEDDYDYDDDYDEDEDDYDEDYDEDEDDEEYDEEALLDAALNWDDDDNDRPNSQETWDDELTSSDSDSDPPTSSSLAAAVTSATTISTTNNNNNLTHLHSLFSRALSLPPEPQTPDPTILFNLTPTQIHSTQTSESHLLASIYPSPLFQPVSKHLWTLHLPTDALKPFCKPDKPYPDHFVLEIHFRTGSRYPYEPPLPILRDPTGAVGERQCLMVSLGLYKEAAGWVGEPMVLEMVGWLETLEAVRAVLEPPSVRVLEEIEACLRAQRVASAGGGGKAKSMSVVLPAYTPPLNNNKKKTVQQQVRPSRGSPVPRYREVGKGVGVAITLKKDQGTERTVSGYIQDVLTAGDHPRGIKVRLTDGQVGRVQFLTGETEPKNITSDSVSKLGSELNKKLHLNPPEKNPIITGFGPRPTPPPLVIEPEIQAQIHHHHPIKPFRPNIPAHQIAKESQEMLKDFEKLRKTPAYLSMQKQRQSLPAFQLREEILRVVKENQVVIVSGETGCGKSTQVPQYILDDAILSHTGGRCKILVTQPRRISALGVSERVASERGEKLGVGSVGYHIRLENKMSEKTKILFCTTGILLRRLEDAPDGEQGEGGEGGGGIDDVSHIIVDEVHERSLDSDFLLMVLRDLLVIRPDIKVILMSATLNAELFAGYFGGAPTVHIPGRTFPVKVMYLEDALGAVNYKVQGADYTRKPNPPLLNRNHKHPPKNQQQQQGIKEEEEEEPRDEELDFKGLMKRYPHMTEQAGKTLCMMDLEKIHYPLIELLVVDVVQRLLGVDVGGLAPPGAKRGGRGGYSGGRGGRGRGGGNRGGGRGGGGFNGGRDSQQQAYTPNSNPGLQQPNRGVLIFLPGYAEIATLHETLLSNPVVRQATHQGRFCFALHSTLSSDEQLRVFNRPPDSTVKIVIATNVAETSITIDDIVYVIDAGKMKETRFDPTKGMASLEECWVSQANALQRRGRAGRVQEGTCIHLFTRFKFEKGMLEQQPPEIRRTPLEQVCLRIKILPFLKGGIGGVLGRVIEPPSEEAVKAAIGSLRTLRALTIEEELTPLGFHLGRLPVDVRIGKLILYGSIFRCLDPVLTIASAMSVKSPFVAPFEKRELADEKKMAFATGVSDHLTLLAAYNAWQTVRANGFAAERQFLYDNFLSGRTLTMIASVKRQLAELLSDIGFVGTKVRAREMEYRGGRVSDGVAEAIGEGGMKGQYDSELIKAVLVTALYPNVVKIDVPKGAGKAIGPQDLKMFVRGSEEVFIHPTSVNWKTKMYPSPFLVYHEKVKTTKVYIRDSSCVSPYALAFFGGGRLSCDRRQGILNLDDGWIRFSASVKASAVIEAIRTAFDELLQLKIENPELDVSSTNLVKEIVRLVTFHSTAR